MNDRACLDLGNKLAADYLAMEALLSSGEPATAFLVMQLRKRLKVQAADYQAAAKEPLKIAPWSPWNGIVRGGPVATPDSSVGTPGGREL